MRGWFDSFRNDGGPTLYNFNNRTAVAGDVTFITFLTIFCTVYTAFLIIFPGVRKERLSTLFAVTLSLLVGATILISLFGSAWHVGSASIAGTYRAFSKDKVLADIGVHVGLQHFNVTLKARPYNGTTIDFDFNEQFSWSSSSSETGSASDTFRNAILHGLPFPILTVAEYFTRGQEGLSWGGQYRAAGYYCATMLWTTLAVWLLMNLMLVVVPRYGAILMTTCGLFLVATTCGYYELLPEDTLLIRIDDSVVNFQFGWCYWLVLISGGLCILAGVVITIIEIVKPHSFSTILEVDYDTPYDRHIIIQDSQGTKMFQRRKWANANGTSFVGGNCDRDANLPPQPPPPNFRFGTKIIRRLSSKRRALQTCKKPTTPPQHSGYNVVELPTQINNWKLSEATRGSGWRKHAEHLHKDGLQLPITHLPRVQPPERLLNVEMW